VSLKPTLSPAQRRRALSPTLAGFVKLLKIERMLLASMPEASKTEPGGQERFPAKLVASKCRY
jgi:hypothetical protein